MNFYIHQIPLWEDNYIYVIQETVSKITAVIDPGDACVVNDFLEKKKLKLDLILNTHNHFDHIGGNESLKQKWGCKIYGFKGDVKRIPGIDQTLKEGDKICVGSLIFEVLFVPGHTSGHIAFWNKSYKILFCGDVLFAMGCGRLFEGTAEEMFSSLAKIKKLPKKSLVYCAHEYTLKNAQFALSLESANEDLNKRFQKIKQLRDNKQATVPFYLEEELLTNPFLRSQSVKEFKKIRKLRDVFTLL